MSPTRLPKISVTLDPDSAAALAREAAARGQSRADFIRDAVAQELHVRAAAQAAMLAALGREMARRTEAARIVASAVAQGPTRAAAALAPAIAARAKTIAAPWAEPMSAGPSQAPRIIKARP